MDTKVAKRYFVTAIGISNRALDPDSSETIFYFRIVNSQSKHLTGGTFLKTGISRTEKGVFLAARSTKLLIALRTDSLI
jgi:hypothetical protein